METLTVKLTGTVPLLLNNNRTVDPLDYYKQKMQLITDKGSKKMTLEDHANLYEIKWNAALYHDDDLGPYIPADNILRCIRDGAAAARKGKDVYRAVTILQDKAPIMYKGPRDREKLYAKRDFVLIKQAKMNGKSTVMTCRPIFNAWTIQFDVLFDASVINRAALLTAMEVAGALEGIGTWRPRFGRFKVEELV